MGKRRKHNDFKKCGCKALFHNATQYQCLLIPKPIYGEQMSDDYLMMDRVMGREWHRYQVENVWGKGYTGHMEIALKRTYEQAFMAGFYLKFTKGDEK